MEKDIKIPQHVAIILDGNGRWAKSKGMPRNYGHVQGAKTVETICREAWNMGIKYLTVYAFSTENWKRPQDEVDALMKLLRNYMKNCLKTAEKNHMRVRVIGDKTGLAEDIQKSVAELEEASKDNDGLNFQIAINYGSRDEMVRAMKKMAADRGCRKIKCSGYQRGDLCRVSGYRRHSGSGSADPHQRGAAPVQLSSHGSWLIRSFILPMYTGRIFPKRSLKRPILAYNKRDRRYGGVREE